MRKLKLLLLGGLLLSTQLLLAQTREITGKVIDASGAAIPGATIKVKGQKGGTIASYDGSFKVNAASNAVLVITAVGYEEKEMNIGNNTTIAAQLLQDTRAMSEVVVTGTGVATSKRKLGISVESISGDKLPLVPAASLDQAIIGKVPGAQISSVSGNPGDKVNIVLRGINTVQGGTRPLILLDGVEMPLDNFNTVDIGQVER